MSATTMAATASWIVFDLARTPLQERRDVDPVGNPTASDQGILPASGKRAARSSTAPGIGIRAWGEHCWPDSLDVMGWRVEDDGFGVLFSRDIPTLVRERFAAATDAFLRKHGLGRGDLAGYVCHPGGAKVVAALEEALDLAPGAMTAAREVLRDFGNMSAPSVLFVLERMLAEGALGVHLLSSLGPGFSAGFALLDAP